MIFLYNYFFQEKSSQKTGNF